MASMLYDRAEIKGTARITKDGYFVADALVARADNIQTYRAYELGLTDRDPQDPVRVFRPAAEVFKREAMASLAHRPITLDHPSDNVSAGNWKELAVGDIGDEIMRDGEFIRVPVKVMDAKAIDSIKTDRREFSLGYSLDLDMTPGEHAGEAYDAVAREFRYNHLAAVKAARGGPDLRIVDERTYEPNGDGDKTGLEPSSKDGGSQVATKTITFDGLPLEVTDAAEAAIAKLQGQLKDATAAKEAADKALVDANAALETEKGKVTALEQQVKDAKITPDKLEKMVADRAALVAKAKAIEPKVVTDGKTEAEIRKAVIEARLGDAAKDMSDDAIAGAFAVLAKDAKPADKVRDGIRESVSAQAGDDDVEKAYSEMVDGLTDAWKPQKAA